MTGKLIMLKNQMFCFLVSIKTLHWRYREKYELTDIQNKEKLKYYVIYNLCSPATINKYKITYYELNTRNFKDLNKVATELFANKISSVRNL